MPASPGQVSQSLLWEKITHVIGLMSHVSVMGRTGGEGACGRVGFETVGLCWVKDKPTIRRLFPTWGLSSTSQHPALWPVLIDYWDGTRPREMRRILAELPGHSIKERLEGLKYGRWN